MANPSTFPVRIFRYKATHLYKRRPKLIQYLKDNLNNIAEGSLDRYGNKVGSGMKSEINDGRLGHIWIAWLDGKAIAWGMLTSRKDNRKLQIGVYVHPDYRRNGIGSRLIEKAKTHAKAKKRSLVSQGWDYRGKNFYSENGIPYAYTWDHGGWIE